MVFEKMHAVFLVVILQFLECSFQGDRTQSTTLISNNYNTTRQMHLNKSVNLDNYKGPTEFEHENLRRNFIKAKLRSEIHNTTSKDVNETFIRNTPNTNNRTSFVDSYESSYESYYESSDSEETHHFREEFERLTHTEKKTKTVKNKTIKHTDKRDNKNLNLKNIARATEATQVDISRERLATRIEENAKSVPKAMDNKTNDFDKNAGERNSEDKNKENDPKAIKDEYEAVSKNVSRSPDGQRRIVGGSNVDISLYPYHAAYGVNCAAAIIDSRWVITVAHCGEKPYIRTGTTYLTHGRRTKVKNYFPHPGWDAENKSHPFDYDFQLLELAFPLMFNHNTQPIKIADIEDLVPGRMIVVTGWGNMEEDGAYSNVLKAVRVPVISKSVCQRVQFPYFRGQLTPRMFCAGYHNMKKDACQGDSGGPAASGEKLLGMVSFGYGCATPGSYGVYSQVVEMRDWIQNVTGLNLNSTIIDRGYLSDV